MLVVCRFRCPSTVDFPSSNRTAEVNIGRPFSPNFTPLCSFERSTVENAGAHHTAEENIGSHFLVDICTSDGGGEYRKPLFSRHLPSDKCIHASSTRQLQVASELLCTETTFNQKWCDMPQTGLWFCWVVLRCIKCWPARGWNYKFNIDVF